MTDEEFMIYLFGLLWDDLVDGNTPDDGDFELIEKEFEDRGIDYSELTPY